MVPEYDGQTPEPDPSEPTVPDPVQEPSDLIWPFNVIVDFLHAVGQWIVDMIASGQATLKQGQLDFEKNITSHITGSINWFFEALGKIIVDMQAAVEKKVVDVQKVTDLAITTSQKSIDLSVATVKAKIEKVVTDMQKLTNLTIKGTQAVLEAKLGEAEKRLDTISGGVKGITDVIQKEVGPAITSHINKLFGPFLRDLNRSLEAV